MPIAESVSRNKYPLSRRKIIKKTISNSIVWLVLLTFAYVPTNLALNDFSSGANIKINGEQIAFSLSIPLWVLFAFYLLVIGLVYTYQVWYFNTYYYELGDTEVTIRKNPITPNEITMPYERLQDVYVDQDWLDRIFGLYDVHISTTTANSNFLAHIDGVEKTAAEGLRKQFLETIRKRLQKTGGSISDTPSSETNISQEVNK